MARRGRTEGGVPECLGLRACTCCHECRKFRLKAALANDRLKGFGSSHGIESPVILAGRIWAPIHIGAVTDLEDSLDPKQPNSIHYSRAAVSWLLKAVSKEGRLGTVVS